MAKKKIPPFEFNRFWYKIYGRAEGIHESHFDKRKIEKRNFSHLSIRSRIEVGFLLAQEYSGVSS